MKGYEYITTFSPYHSNEAYEEMERFFQDNDLDFDDWYVSKHIGDFYLEFEESGHERDSSGDHLTVWKKISD